MIDPDHKLSISRQAKLLKISHSAIYYRPRQISDMDLMLMRRLDELHLNYPFAGSRMLRDMLSQQGLEVGRRHVRTLMRRTGIEALYRKPNTSKPAPGHKIYPYLLRGLMITLPNQAWAVDISYIPMAHGFVYLAAVIDWFSVATQPEQNPRHIVGVDSFIPILVRTHENGHLFRQGDNPHLSTILSHS